MDIDDCSIPDEPCENDGVCTDYVDNFSCDCPERTIGYTCTANPCLPNPCQNFAICDVSECVIGSVILSGAVGLKLDKIQHGMLYHSPYCKLSFVVRNNRCGLLLMLTKHEHLLQIVNSTVDQRYGLYSFDCVCVTGFTGTLARSVGPT